MPRRRLLRSAGSDARRTGQRDVIDLVEGGPAERATSPPATRDVHEAAVERIVQRVGQLSSFTKDEVRQIARIALAAMSVDDADRQRRDETARENRQRLRRLGRD